MVWRVRATLPDRPGALALLARQCGDADVNILGLQVFPDVGAVTDELVLRAPHGWGAAEVRALVEAAGARVVEVVSCTEAALVDQPTRYVQAARAILHDPMAFPQVVGSLLGAGDAEPPGGAGGAHDTAGRDDVLEVAVGDLVMQVRRATPFTATEQARATALAALVTDVLERAGAADHPQVDGRRLGSGATPEHVVDGPHVSAVVDGVVVGRATVLEDSGDPGDPGGSRQVRVRVDPAWRRRGIGTRLLTDVARLARARGVEEIVLTTEAGNQAVLPMVMAAGLRGRLRASGDVLVVRVPVAGLRPLPT